VTAKSIVVSVLLLGLTATASAASVITQNTSGSQATVLSGFYAAQSVTTPTGGPWNTIGFSFEQCATPSGTSCLSTTTNSPFALGGLYLLSQIYDGLPSALSSATPGFIGFTSTITGGVWTFASSLTLNPSTQYFFYMDTAFNGPEILYSTANPYAGGLATGTDPASPPSQSLRRMDCCWRDWGFWAWWRDAGKLGQCAA
jgi:hypothetical protein